MFYKRAFLLNSLKVTSMRVMLQTSLKYWQLTFLTANFCQHFSNVTVPKLCIISIEKYDFYFQSWHKFNHTKVWSHLTKFWGQNFHFISLKTCLIGISYKFPMRLAHVQAHHMYSYNLFSKCMLLIFFFVWMNYLCICAIGNILQ